MTDYQKELFAQKTPYLQWLRGRNTAGTYAASDIGEQLCVFSFSSCEDSVEAVIGAKADREKDYLFINRDGRLCEGARGLIAESLLNNPQALAVYADEDYFGTLQELYHIDGDGFGSEVTSEYEKSEDGLYRGEPWFKPDFSPDTLESFFYIGNVFAVRGSVIADASPQISFCDLMRGISRRITAESAGSFEHGRERLLHIPEVLYTNNRLAKKDVLEGFCESAPPCTYADIGRFSVIIPSKDNPKALKECIGSLERCFARDKDDAPDYELIVVDNGSMDENRAEIERFLNDRGYGYIFRRMEFNFSAMCNLGAVGATGELLLFLNDDVTCPEGQNGAWLKKMLCYASKAHVGAVGIKLRYPGGDLLQHTGITNMGVGPAHKLGGVSDAGNLYHGHNLADGDMLAVTAACMAISREKWERAGGFDEELGVAYNDVELCFRLYRSGLYNVQVNSEFLIHHESLSRGGDTSEEKRKRLFSEMRKLYEKHPWAKAFDPFYSPNLVQWEKDALYNVCCQYPFDKIVKPEALTSKELHLLLKQKRRESAAKKRGKAFERLYDKLTGAGRHMLTIDSVEVSGNVMTVTGWHVMRGSDNARLVKRLWLYNADRLYEARLHPKLREDAEALFAAERDTVNTALSGICARLDISELAGDEYKIAIVVECGGRRSVSFAD
ncbi:MAG: glycosyltransferase [Lachnospiraceae bacterium]|nr:glycosyltransferase [Lachnospiraceae bacterium]